MKKALSQYRASSNYVKGMSSLYHSSRPKRSFSDKHDISRAQLIMIVSALDHFIHEIVRMGMLEVYEGKRPPTAAFNKFQVSLSSAIAGLTSKPGTAWLSDFVRSVHSYKSFQKSERIAEAVKLFRAGNVWDDVATNLSQSRDDTTRELDLIVERRNRIAHEADLDPTFPGRRYPISRADVRRSITHVDASVKALYLVVKL